MSLEKRKRTDKVEASEKETKTWNIFAILTKLGLFFIALAFVGVSLTFYPVVFKELNYYFLKPYKKDIVIASRSGFKTTLSGKDVMVAADDEFSILVPKIDANSKIIPDVDPYDSKVYQVALTKGVAHAKGTVYPGEIGNSFYFAHSSDNFYNANRYNSVFYLLNKLENGDSFFLVYKGNIFEYKVTEKKIAPPESINYLKAETKEKTATLMTCWPAGTTISRLVIVGKMVEKQ